MSRPAPRRRGPVLVVALVLCLGLLWIDDASPATGPAGVRMGAADGGAAVVHDLAGSDGGTPVAQGLGASDGGIPVAHGSAASDGGTPVGAGRQVIGCSSHPGRIVLRGSPAGAAVALTFDDGPSLTQTPAILAILDRLHAKATFFEEGRHVHGREALMRQILASGDEIGNHSFDHPRYPGYGELASTQRRIRRATGFDPCLFRPPYGLLDPKVESAARRAGLEIVLWSLDSHDDHHPGAQAIVSNALAARPGSIVLMHDGGHHPQTVRALPAVIRGLRSRGLHLVTVSRLLGERMRHSGR